MDPNSSPHQSTGSIDDDEDSQFSFHWMRYKLLLWKNCCVHWNNRRQFFLIMLLPSFCCLIMVCLRLNAEVLHLPAVSPPITNVEVMWQHLLDELERRQHNLSDVEGAPIYNTYMPQMIIAYAPNNIDAIKNIMAKAMEGPPARMALLPFATCNDMCDGIWNHHYFAGVCFEGKYSSLINPLGIYPRRLNYTLIFPSELRLYDDSYISASWETPLSDYFNRQSDFAKHLSGVKRFSLYEREGFIMLQNAISTAYIALATGSKSLPEFFIRRFPVAAHSYDFLIEGLNITLPMLLVLGYICPILYFLKQILYEAERKLNNVLQILGVTTVVQFMAWFSFAFITLLASSIITLAILKIHWCDGFAVLTKAAFFPTLIVLIAYNVNSLCFSFMMSKVSTAPTSTISLAAAIWFLTYLPFIMSLRYGDAIAPAYFCLFPNTTFALALVSVITQELSCGLDWRNFFQNQSLAKRWSVGSYVLILLVSSFVQALIGICVPSIRQRISSVKRHIRGLGKRSTQMPRREAENKTQNKGRRTTIVAIEHSFEHSIVQIENVSKELGKTLVLDGVSFNLCENNVTVLLGHNGAGKTTLISIIAGLMRATAGTVSINNCNIETDTSNARASLGICHSDKLLFENLNVNDQLRFFSYLKGTGMTEAQTNVEVERYLSATHMNDHRYVVTEKLSGGQRQMLAVCCALIGRSQVVLLDDPTSKMEFTNRYLFWQLLHKEKSERAILVTTHMLWETELYADRVMMLSRGKLTCNGTCFLLKSVNSTGHRLTLTIGEDCDVEKINAVLRNHIPNVRLDLNNGKELVYAIGEHSVDSWRALFKELETNMTELLIETIGFNDSSINDLFYRMGVPRRGRNTLQNYKRALIGHSEYKEEDDVLLLLEEKGTLSSLERFWYQFLATCHKHIDYFMAHKYQYIITIMAGPLISALFFILMSFDLGPHSGVYFDLCQYPQSEALIDTLGQQNEFTGTVIEEWTQNIFWYCGVHNQKHLVDETIADYILQKQHCTKDYRNIAHLVGASINLLHVTAWFNHFLSHTAPLSLNMAHNAVLRAMVPITSGGSNYAKITVSFRSLPVQRTAELSLFPAQLSLGCSLAIVMAICLCYGVCLSTVFLVRERQSFFKALQHIAGLSIPKFWLFTFLCDIPKITIMTTLMVIAAYFMFRRFEISFLLVWYFILLQLVCIALLSTSYLLSHCFSQYNRAYVILTSLHIIGTGSFEAYIAVNGKIYSDLLDTSDFFDDIFQIFPLFSFCRAVVNLQSISLTRSICMDPTIKIISTKLEQCKMQPNCCGKFDVLSRACGIQSDLIALILIIVVSWCLLFLYEYRHVINTKFKAYLKRSNNNEPAVNYRRSTFNSLAKEVSVEDMKARIARQNSPEDHTLICENVSKKHGSDKWVLSRISFLLNSGDCFGLLSNDFESMSLLVAVLAGQRHLDSGHVVIKNREFGYEHISYAPVIRPMLQEYTAKEMLHIFCLLYGFRPRRIDAICRNLAKRLGFFTHLEVQLMYCSGGLRRRISVAIAMLKKAPLLLLDNPTRNLDPYGRRQLFNVIGQLRESGTTVLFTTTQLRDLMNYCSKLAFMRKGRFICIGSPRRVSLEHQQGYFIYVRFKSSLKTNPGLTGKYFLQFATFMETQFTNSIMLEYSCNVATFFIPFGEVQIDIVYSKLQTNVYMLNIETYFITTDPLGEVYRNAMLEHELNEKEAHASVTHM